MKRLNFLVCKDNNDLPITKDYIEEFNQLEKELLEINFEYLGNGLIADLEEEIINLFFLIYNIKLNFDL